MDAITLAALAAFPGRLEAHYGLIGDSAQAFAEFCRARRKTIELVSNLSPRNLRVPQYLKDACNAARSGA
jgi:hypothetical protein